LKHLRQQDTSTFRYLPCTDQSKAKWKKNITDVHTKTGTFHVLLARSQGTIQRSANMAVEDCKVASWAPVIKQRF